MRAWPPIRWSRFSAATVKISDFVAFPGNPGGTSCWLGSIFLSCTLSADAFNGYLTTSRSAVSFADLASTPNQKAVANALETTGFSWNDMLTPRQVAVVNVVDTQRGDYALKTTQVFGEVGYTYASRAGALEPFLNLAYVRVDGGINELGLAAMTGSATLDTAYTTLGLRGATALTQTLTARGTLGWRHALGDVEPVAVLAFQSGSPFTLAGSPIARDALVTEAGLDLAVAANASFGISWAGQFADHSHNNMVKGSFSWRF